MKRPCSKPRVFISESIPLSQRYTFCIFVQATGFTGVVLKFKVERQRHFLEAKMLIEGTHEIWTSFSCVFASISNIFPTSSGTRLRKATNGAKALRRQKQTTHFLQSCNFKKRRLVGASGWKVLRTHPYLQSCKYGCVEVYIHEFCFRKV